MQEICLGDYLAFLDKQPAEGFKRGDADRFLRDNVVSQADIAPYIFFREETYSRNLVAQRHTYEVLVISWLPGQRSPIHDHFGQRCWIRILSGQLSVRNYRYPENSTAPPTPLGPEEKVPCPSQIHVDDDMGIHSISNSSALPAISIHVYASPLSHCRIFNEVTQEFEVVSLGYSTSFGKVVPSHPPALQHKMDRGH